MKTTLESNRPLEPGVALMISERDENGALVGYYKGYWVPDRHAIDLYPMHNPYCWWRVPRVKHEVSEYVVSVPGPVRTVSGSAPPQVKKNKKTAKAEGIKPSTAQAMRDLCGQTRIKF